MTLRKLIALCATIVAIGLSARAADYTPVFSQDFEVAATYANEMRNGSFANAALGTETTAASPLTASVAQEAVTVDTSNRGPAISWESRTKGDGTRKSQYFRWGSYGKSTGHLLFVLPESCQVESISDYRLSFDYFLSSSFANKNSASNGLAIVSTSGATLATFAVPPHTTTGFLFKGGDIEAKLCDVVAGSRGTFDVEGSWLHIEVRGIRESGVFLTVTRENAEGTVYVADERIADAFDTVGNIFLRSVAAEYVHYTQIDNVLFETVMPSTYTWTGEAGDNMWKNPANWTVRGAVPSQPPVRGDYVEIEQEALDAMDVAVLLEAHDQGKVFVETFSRTTKYWTNATRNGDWFAPANWSYDAAERTVSTTAPNPNDTLIFPARFADGATILLTKNACATDKPGDGFYLVADCQVLLKSDSKEVRYINPFSVTGSGRLILDTIQLRTKIFGTCSIEVPLEISGDDVRIHARGSNAHVDIKGNLTGSGMVTLSGDNGNNNRLYGDASEFTGTLANTYNFFVYSADGLNFARAKLDFASAGNLIIDSSNTEAESLKVGVLTGAGKITSNLSKNLTFEVGALNADATSAVILGGAATTWTVKKVGAGTQTLTGCDGFNVDLTSGNLVVTNGAALGTISANGGKLEFVADASWVDEEPHLLFSYEGALPERTLTDYVYANNAELGGSYLPTYDTATEAGKVYVKFTKHSIAWVGPKNGLWSDALNWQINGAPAMNPPTANDDVTIPENSVIIIDANQEFGTMTLGEDVSFKVLFTDDNLTFTIPEGLTVAQVIPLGPYVASEAEGVWTATRVASTFVWSNAVENGVWTERGNWIVKDAPTGVIPGREDTVIFPSRTEGCWSVAMGDVECVVANVTLNADVLFTGKTLRPYAIEGEGAIKMGNGFVLAHPGAELEFDNPIEAVADSAENRAWFSIPSQFRITVNGNVTGSGYIGVKVANKVNYSGVTFAGDLRAFSGNLATMANDIDRNQTYFLGENSWSESASFELACGGGTTFQNGGKTVKLGSLKGKINHADQTSCQNMTFEIGDLNGADDSISGWIFTPAYPSLCSSRGHTIRKVGTGTLEVSTFNNKAYEIENGVMRLMSDRSYRTMWNTKIVTDPAEATGTNYATIAFTGTGTLALPPAFTEDVSATILNSVGAIAIDDGGVDRTWTTALDASNVGGFCKKGEGALTLEAQPQYSGYTRVESGKLVLPEETSFVWDISSPVALADAIEGGSVPAAYGMGSATGVWVYGVNSWDDINDTVDLTNLKAIDLTAVAEIAKGEQFVIMTAKAFYVNGALMTKAQCEAITIVLNDSVKAYAAERGYALRIQGNNLVYAPKTGFAIIIR